MSIVNTLSLESNRQIKINFVYSKTKSRVLSMLAGMIVAAGTSKGMDVGDEWLKNRKAGIGASKGGNYSNINEGLNFSSKAAEHMGESARQVHVQTLQDVIKQGNAFPDPRGSSATMYYSQMYINGKMYNIEVLYDEGSNTVYHFEYARKAMGNLPAIKK